MNPVEAAGPPKLIRNQRRGSFPITDPRDLYLFSPLQFLNRFSCAQLSPICYFEATVFSLYSIPLAIDCDPGKHFLPKEAKALCGINHLI